MEVQSKIKNTKITMMRMTFPLTMRELSLEKSCRKVSKRALSRSKSSRAHLHLTTTKKERRRKKRKRKTMRM